jgi:hypothetical protein
MNAGHTFVEQLLVHFTHNRLVASLRKGLGDAPTHQTTSDNAGSSYSHSILLLVFT